MGMFKSTMLKPERYRLRGLETWNLKLFIRPILNIAYYSLLHNTKVCEKIKNQGVASFRFHVSGKKTFFLHDQGGQGFSRSKETRPILMSLALWLFHSYDTGWTSAKEQIIIAHYREP